MFFSQFAKRVNGIQINPYDKKSGVLIERPLFKHLKEFTIQMMMEGIAYDIEYCAINNPSVSELKSLCEAFAVWNNFVVICDHLKKAELTSTGLLIVFTDLPALYHFTSIQKLRKHDVNFYSNCSGFTVIQYADQTKAKGIVFNAGSPFEMRWSENTLKFLSKDIAARINRREFKEKQKEEQRKLRDEEGGTQVETQEETQEGDEEENSVDEILKLKQKEVRS